MPFHQPDQLRYYTFDSLSESGAVHGVFTRRGGVSPEPWDTLNVGGTVGDRPERVFENRRRSFEQFGRSTASIFDVWQVHSSDVVCADSPRLREAPHQKADAILTDQPGVTLFMRFADCVPILLHDPVKNVVGLVHAGWQGTVQGTITAAVSAMRDCYRSNPSDIVAAIGPSIAAHHYPIGPDVAQQVEAAFGASAADLLSPVATENGNRVQFDLWAANRLLLQRSGVRRIEISGFCTACHLVDWYSHRGDHGKTGRFGVLIGL